MYAGVILPLPLPGLFTYHVPEALVWKVSPGVRVTVPFGSRKLLSGIILTVSQEFSGDLKIKDILNVLDDNPVVNDLQLRFWQWVAGYYSCTLGEVSKAALPSGLKLESETRIFLQQGTYDASALPPLEQTVFHLLEKGKSLSIHDIVSTTHRNDIHLALKGLLDKGIVYANESLKEGYKPRIKPYLVLNAVWHSPGKQKELPSLLKRYPKQLKLAEEFIRLTEEAPDNEPCLIGRQELLAATGSGSSVLNQLLEKKVLDIVYREDSRLDKNDSAGSGISGLNHAQQQALDEICTQFKTKDTILLHGVTSSGKTEIYIHLIRDILAEGKQVLYLLPEIALTTQIIRRLKKAFGSQVGVYHSKFSDAERVETWKNLLNPDDPSAFKLILGVRSSIFLPFTRLGLIIVDEEHENTYKQFDPAPRYHARDAAIVLAGMHGARVLLGSATPSLESRFNYDLGKYGLVTLTERYRDLRMPEIIVVDTRLERKKKAMKSLFSDQLLNEISNALDHHEQVILFQNRRGFAPYLQCQSCGWVPVCRTCDVSLTWHKQLNQLVCHYCGAVYPTPKVCQSCGKPELKTMGFGTEKVEDEIALFFPKARIRRMDLDSTRSRSAYQKIIEDFEARRTDILVGTQMITKGLDFDHVRVVGILNADNLLNYPDFRAFERAFQLMEQVSGRAGRKEGQGRVIIQTSQPDHRVIRQVVKHDYMALYRTEILERRQFNYPPFSRLLKITVRHRDNDITALAATRLADTLRLEFPGRVAGPDTPLVGRIQNKYLRNIILKVERDKHLQETKERIAFMLSSFTKIPEFKNVELVVDVDPA